VGFLDLLLSEIEIKNLLSYKNAIFTKLKNFNVLIGKNNAGKSNLFKILQVIKTSLNNSKITQKILFDDNPELQGEISLTFKFSDNYLKELLLKLHSMNSFLSILKDTLDIPKSDEKEIINFIIKNQYYNSLKIKLTYINNFPDILFLQGVYLIHKDNKSQSIFELRIEDGKYSVYVLRQSISDFENLMSMDEYIEYGKFEKVDQEYPKTTLGNFFRSYQYDNIYLSTLLPKIGDFFRDSLFFIPDNRNFPDMLETVGADTEILKEDGSTFIRYIFKQENNPEGKLWMEELNYELRDFFPNLRSLSQKFLTNQTGVYYQENNLNIGIEKENMGAAILHISFFLSFLKNIKKESILLIEEPELFIYPGLQKLLLNKFLDVSGNIQIFITTHSPIFLSRNFEKCSIQFVNKINNFSVIKSISDHEIVDIFTDLDLSFYDYLLYDGILFVEGSKDLKVISIIIEHIFKETLKIIPIEGKENFKHFASTKILIYLSKKNLKFLFLLDRDRGNQDFYYRIDDENVREHVKERIITLFTYEIENIFLQPILIIDYILTIRPNTDLKELSSFIYQNIQNQFKINGLNNYEFVLKSFNDVYFPRLYRDEIKEVLKESEKIFSLEDAIKIWIVQITKISSEKLRYFLDPNLNVDRIKDKLKEINKKYNVLYKEKKFNKIISGKKVFKRISSNISNKFRLGKFNLEELAKHLIILIGAYNIFRKEILNKPGNQGSFKEVASISNSDIDKLECLKREEIEIFKNFCENYINLIQTIRSKLNIHFKEEKEYDTIDFSILKEFLIQRWNLGEIF